MLYKNIAIGLSSLSRLVVALPPVEIVARQVECPNGYQQAYVATQVVTYPLVINQFFENNTIINVGGITININNAPVTFSTTVTASTTQTVTSSLTIGATSVPTSFVLQVGLGVGKRQTGSSQYVGASGNTVSDCTSATVFQLQGGRLSSGSLGISAPDAIESIVFAVSSTEGQISQTFSVLNGGLEFTNPAFFRGIAVFCITNGLVTANFQNATQSCAGVSLILATCGGATSGSTTTSSSPLGGGSSISTATASPSSSPSGTSTSASASVSVSASAIACPIAGETLVAGACACLSPLVTGTDLITGAANCGPVTDCTAVTGSKLDTAVNQCVCSVAAETIVAGACACLSPLVTGTDLITGALNCAPVTKCIGTGATLNTITNQCVCSVAAETVVAGACACLSPLVTGTDLITGAANCAPVTKCIATGATLNTITNQCACTVAGKVIVAGACACLSPLVTGTNPITGAANCGPVTACTATGATLNTITNQCACGILGEVIVSNVCVCLPPKVLALGICA